MHEQASHSAPSSLGDRSPLDCAPHSPGSGGDDHPQRGGGAPPARTQRHDGWTPERIRIFLHALADGKNVAAAAGAAGMSRQGAYAYRAGAGGRPFAVAWQSARELARRRRLDGVMDEIIAKRLRRLQRLVGPGHRVVIELPGAREDRGDPDAMHTWYR